MVTMQAFIKRCLPKFIKLFPIPFLKTFQSKGFLFLPRRSGIAVIKVSCEHTRHYSPLTIHNSPIQLFLPFKELFMQLFEVKDDQAAKEFLAVNKIINGHNPNYIQPLDKDINDVFDEKRIRRFAMAKLSAGY